MPPGPAKAAGTWPFKFFEELTGVGRGFGGLLGGALGVEVRNQFSTDHYPLGTFGPFDPDLGQVFDPEIEQTGLAGQRRVFGFGGRGQCDGRFPAEGFNIERAAAGQVEHTLAQL